MPNRSAAARSLIPSIRTAAGPSHKAPLSSSPPPAESDMGPQLPQFCSGAAKQIGRFPDGLLLRLLHPVWAMTFLSLQPSDTLPAGLSSLMPGTGKSISQSCIALGIVGRCLLITDSVPHGLKQDRQPKRRGDMRITANVNPKHRNPSGPPLRIVAMLPVHLKYESISQTFENAPFKGTAA